MTVTVDLDQLREASVDEHSVWEAAQAVLSAPVVWWCETDQRGDARQIPPDAAIPPTRGRCGGCGHVPERSGCRSVALVPVTGEGR